MFVSSTNNIDELFLKNLNIYGLSCQLTNCICNKAALIVRYQTKQQCKKVLLKLNYQIHGLKLGPKPEVNDRVLV